MKEQSIIELQEEMNSGKLTAKGLVAKYLKRIETVDRQGPKLNAIIEINPDAIKIAENLDFERQQQGSRGPLHGIPVIIKDNIETCDPMATSAGSLALDNNFANEDAPIIKNLRNSGAIILGKANLSEWANFRSTQSTSGWSSKGGQTLNPYALNRTPCGSSAGSAVAVAANLCSCAIGTETDGSIICPSQINSIVGLKPTVGLLSQRGIIPIAHSQDTAGPMARTVTEVAILLSSMVGNTNYQEKLDANALQGARLGVARPLFGKNPHVLKLVDDILNKLAELGVILIDPVELSVSDDIGEAEYEVLLYEFKQDLNLYLAKLPNSAHVHNLKELIQYNLHHEEDIMPFFKQEILIEAETKGDLSEKAYTESLQKCQKAMRDNGIDKIMKDNNLDVIIAPSGDPAWPIDLINGDHFTSSSSAPAAISGYPSVTVPMGYIFDLPVGLSFIGKPFQEGILLSLAYSFEKHFPVRVPPSYKSMQ